MRNYDEYDKLDLREYLSPLDAQMIANNVDKIESMRRGFNADPREHTGFAKFLCIVYLILMSLMTIAVLWVFIPLIIEGIPLLLESILKVFVNIFELIFT